MENDPHLHVHTLKSVLVLTARSHEFCYAHRKLINTPSSIGTVKLYNMQGGAH